MSHGAPGEWRHSQHSADDVIRGDVDAAAVTKRATSNGIPPRPNQRGIGSRKLRRHDMEHHFVCPKVDEIRSGGDQPPARLRSQRELVEASLLRCPPRRLAWGR
jgi:hypothetical protein